MPLSAEDIGRILAALDGSGWDQAEIVVGDVRIAVGRNDLPAPGTAGPPAAAKVEPPNAPGGDGSAPAKAAVPATRATPEPPGGPPPEDVSAPDDHVLIAPSVGVFWRSPSPGAPPFVEVGGHVEAGDTVGIVEVMKLMNNVLADRPGTVTAVFSENAQHVEYGTPLVAIRADV